MFLLQIEIVKYLKYPNILERLSLMKKLTINIPDSLELDANEVTLLLAAQLYQSSKLSLGQAAELAGLSKRSFAEILGKFDVSLFNFPIKELARDLKNA